MFAKPLALSFLIVIAAIITRHVKTYKDIYTAEELQRKYGPTAVVIGASEGLGAAWADLLCSNGLEVVTIARRSAELEERKRELENKYQCKVSTVTLDLASDDVTSTMQSVFDTHSIGLVIYNAAVFGMGKFTSSLDRQLTGIRVNVESLTRTVHAFATAKAMADRKSSGLIIMSSTLGDTGAAYVATYGATKAYNTILAQGLASEWKSNGLDVLACVAGPISTPNFFR
jgi:short-subunit dehydrogenase